MNYAAAIVAIISVLAALFLAMRGLQSHHLTFERKALFAAIWTLVIIGLAFILGRIGA